MAAASSQKPPASILHISSITPASPSPTAHFFLSPLDICWQDIHYNQRIIFYNPTTAIHDDAINTLKTSLSATLVHYYPWAGRLALDSNARLFIDCNDAGVEFVEASVDTPMSHISQEGFPMMPLYETLCRDMNHAGESLYSSPLLSIQVTRFSDGGMSLGVSQSHVVADGQALWDFMVAWGDCARGHVDIPPSPSHERSLLALKEAPSQEKGQRFLTKFEWKCQEEGEGEEGGESGGGGGGDNEEEQKIQWRGTDPGKADAGAGPGPGLMQCVLDLPASSIKQLKAEAGGRFTAYQVVCAHFWQCVTKARGSPPKTKLRFVGLANLRSKVNPPLPASYFGNVLNLFNVNDRQESVAANDLGGIAGKIHEAIGKTGHESLLEIVHWLELHGNRFVDLFPLWAGVETLNVASSPRFPVYKVDFGWGFPAAVRSARVPGDGEMVLFGGRPGSEPGDMEICLALPSSVMTRLLQDPTFLAKPISSPFRYYD